MDKPPGIEVPDADWANTPRSVQVLVLSLLKSQQHLLQRVEELSQQVAALQTGTRRGGGSGSSSANDQSGSQDRAATSPRKKKPSGRAPGAQPGHEGHGRPLLAVDQVDEQVPVKPTACGHCGQPLAGDDPHPLRHQVIEIPPVRPQVTEYQLHTLRCAHCDGLTEAELPAGVPRSPFGASVAAWCTLLSGAYRLSKRNICALMRDAFGLEMSAGAISQLEQRMSKALAHRVDEARQYVQQQATAHLDETGWRERRKKAWLWTAVTALVSVFLIRPRRDADVARELLGDKTTAIVCSDRGKAYDFLPALQRQACWSHLIRNLEKFVERGGEAKQVGEELLKLTHQLFRWWHRVRDGTLEHSSFRSYVSDLRGRFQFQLWYGEQFADRKTAKTCANLRAIEPALWTFVRKDGDVAPTNNAAERALRHGVLWRKVSFGTHSPAGSRFVERMLTVRETLRQQQRDVLAYLTTACQASMLHRPAPSLLPHCAPPRA